MNQNQIGFLKSLDPDGCYGTVQRVLLDPDLSIVPFENAAKHLLTMINEDRKAIMQENERMRKILVKNGLYNNEVIGKED